jgi:sugar lactone lactonase YvrE
VTPTSVAWPVDVATSLVPGTPCVLGESPIWDPDTGAFYWVDIHQRRLHRWAPGAAESTLVPLAETVTCLGLTQSGRLMGATPDGCALISPRDGAIEHLSRIDLADENLRTNDGKPSPDGRFFFGTQASDHRPGAGDLYRLDPDGRVNVVLAGVTISNGLDWDCAGRRFYYVDSGAYRIDVFDYDGSTGAITNPRPLVSFARSDGMPDGLAIDSQDHIWIAMHGGSVVRRYDQSGELTQEVMFPFEYPTSCCFGGTDGQTLFVTSARHRLTEEQLPQQPLAGRSFAIRVPVKGQPAHRYRDQRESR